MLKIQLFQYLIKANIFRTYGTTRLLFNTYNKDGFKALEIGANIIPKRFGFCAWINIDNLIKLLEKEIERKDETIDNLKSLLKLITIPISETED